jgi:hypothetical protein
MRRLILEFAKTEVERLHGEIPMHNIKTFEILQLLRHDIDEFAAICRIEPTNPDMQFPNMTSEEGLENFSGAQILEREKSGAYIIFIKHKPVPVDVAGLFFQSINGFQSIGGYIVSMEIHEGRIKLIYLGTNKQIKDILATIRENGVRCKIISLTDAKFALNSPLNGLTDKQRKVLTTAFDLGYYSMPRRVSTEQLAKRLGLHKSALQVHRRKAEMRLIAEVLKEQAQKK